MQRVKVPGALRNALDFTGISLPVISRRHDFLRRICHFSPAGGGPHSGPAGRDHRGRGRSGETRPRLGAHPNQKSVTAFAAPNCRFTRQAVSPCKARASGASICFRAAQGWYRTGLTVSNFSFGRADVSATWHDVENRFCARGCSRAIRFILTANQTMRAWPALRLTSSTS